MSSLQHPRQEAMRQFREREHVDVQHCALVFPIRLGETFVDTQPGVIDENVNRDVDRRNLFNQFGYAFRL